ncbi:ABC transporter ATP-binding protein [Paremcibacter congregatus]|uniref:ABC transporter n=1 Tax=Paremcibacter congregatus TaxID=2043170 RepID=A0A2G4YMQ7_9PROT|nr:ABC transporter ATP-binding protein [Paremcibacter congregatus]PHZ83601.1 ABC transporter [Paremcibacter congregatus]QDE27301.1 ABC transporter ATP-binding protein [Paremcibacter congregatus]
MPDTPILQILDLFLSFQGEGHQVDILKGVNLNIDEGTSVAILGPSGSGKSSLLSLMTGLEKQTAGSVTINDHCLDNMSEDQLALFRRDNIGIVLQSFHLIPTMTALENVAVPLELAGRKDAFKIAEEALGHVGLSHRIHHYPTQLSGGEQQRVAIARALAPNPKIIFADEPTGNLDGKTGHKIVELIFNLQKTFNTTLILITHDTEVANHCDRILHIQDGLIAETAPLKDATGKVAE